MKRHAAAALVTLLASTAVYAQSPAPTATYADGRATIGIEALALWFKSSPTPVPIITDDHLGLPWTNTLLGGGSLDMGTDPAFRVFGSFAFNRDLAIEANGLFMSSRSKSRSVASDGSHDSIDLLLPYYDVTRNQEEVTEISYQPEYEGSATETLTHEFSGGELNLVWALQPRGAWNLDLLGGVRYLRLREDYAITTSSPYIPPNPIDIWDTTDEFKTSNQFIGAQIGLRGRFEQGPWTATAAAKVALGNMRQKISIRGRLETNDFNDYGPVQTFTGGYFALSTNIGDTSRDEFAVVPEIALGLGYRVTPNTTLFASYSFLYMSDVVRPGEQMSRRINPTYSLAYAGDPPTPINPPGPAEPKLDVKTSDFWAQSLSIGIAVRF